MSKSSKRNVSSGYQPRKPLEGNRIRVRSKRLDQVDEDKLSLAFWLLAKQLVEDQTATSTDDTPDDDTEPDEVAA
jgi:hypothetical protein